MGYIQKEAERVNGIQGYVSIREASYKRGMSERRGNQYCVQGRIPGLTRFGRSWCIPADAQKPTDPRQKRSCHMETDTIQNN